jgi:hypothetical protein
MKNLNLANLLSEHGFTVFKGKKSQQPLTLPVDIKTRFLRFSLQNKMCLHLDKIQVFDKEGNNLAEGAHTLVSSMYNDSEKYNGQGVVNGDPKGGCGHHTKTEDEPWLLIDLKEVCNLSKIVVFNRDDAFYHRAISLLITSSSDLKNWDKVFDNFAFKLSEPYKVLTPEQQSLADCHALEIGPIRKLIKSLNSEGHKQLAIELLAEGNNALEPFNLSIGPHGLTRTFSIRTEKEKSNAYHALSNLLNVINQDFGVPAFASSGTLLGLVREGQFLGHDDDLDMCYISAKSEPSEIVNERQLLITFLNSKGYKVSNSNVAHLWCKTPEGLTIDIFTGWVEGDNCIMNPLTRSGVPKVSILPLKVNEYHGVGLHIPCAPIEVLELNYGKNWRNPDPLWVFDWGHARKMYDFLYF